MRIDYDSHISEGTASGICGLCESPVSEDEGHKVVIAHGHKHLVHADCVTDLKEKAAEEAEEG